MDVGQGLRAVAAVAAFGGLLEEFRQGRIVARTAEREGMERHAGPLTASWNARFPGFPSDDFPYTSIRGELRRRRRDAYLIDVIVRMLAGRGSVETTLVNAACVFGWQACLLATRLPEARVIGADIDPRWDRLYRLWRGRRLPPNYRFVQDDVFSPRLGVRPTAVVFFGACGAVSDAAIDYAVNAGADYVMCRTCCHDNIGGNLAITPRFSYLNWFFRFKNLAYGSLQGVPKYAGYYFSPAYDRCAYPRSSAGQQLSSTAEFMAVARSSPESDICRAIIDLDRYLCLVERGFRVEYQGELIVAERSADVLETSVGDKSERDETSGAEAPPGREETSAGQARTPRIPADAMTTGRPRSRLCLSRAVRSPIPEWPSSSVSATCCDTRNEHDNELAFNFRNASGPVDQRGALIVGATYIALQ